MGNLIVFKSSFSKGYLITTILLVVFIVDILIGLAQKMAAVPMYSPSFYWIAFALVVFSYLLIFSFLSQIVSVNVDDERVIIQKMLGQIVISRSDLLNVERFHRSKMDMNLFSFRGLFGSIGWFRNKALGTYFSMVKNDKLTVSLRTSRRCYVVSCDRCDELLTLLSSEA